MRLGNSSDGMALGDDDALYQSIKGLIDRSREYGSGIVDGHGFWRGNLFPMMRCYEQWTEEQIVLTLSAQLRWSHFVELLKLDVYYDGSVAEFLQVGTREDFIANFHE